MNKEIVIKKGYAFDKRYELLNGAGSDAVHTSPCYAYAVCVLKTDAKLEGVGLAFTLGRGNDMVCRAIEYLLPYIEGEEINVLMSDFGEVYKKMTDDPGLRWLGPHKGVVHLALAAVVNACFDLWAKSRDMPLWKLLIELSPEALIRLLDFSYCEDVLSKDEAIQLLEESKKEKELRMQLLNIGYPAYDTSIGWFNYTDQDIQTNVKRAMDNGFKAMKLKVGSIDKQRDIRRAHLIRETAGDEAIIMFDANQQWNVSKAIDLCKELKKVQPFWIEEPTHPDDVYAHVRIKEETAVPLAMGEHISNKVLFKNFLQAGCMNFNQVDVVRVGGISEFILISLLSRKFEVPVVPHIGDMGQIHQHLVLFNHIALKHPIVFLEHIPHLQEYFKYPIKIKEGNYQTPQTAGISSELLMY